MIRRDLTRYLEKKGSRIFDPTWTSAQLSLTLPQYAIYMGEASMILVINNNAEK